MSSAIDVLQVGISVASTLLGVALTIAYERIGQRYKFKKELRDNNNIDVSGDDWFAAWQTSVDQKIVLNTERICMIQNGQTVKVSNMDRAPENPEGGYLWDAQMQFFHGTHLMGWYFARPEENNNSKGIMFFSYHSPRKVFYGKWVGAAYDGSLCQGFLVITKDRAKSLKFLQDIIAMHSDRVNIIYDTMTPDNNTPAQT